MSKDKRTLAALKKCEREQAIEQLAKHFRKLSDDELARLFTEEAGESEVSAFLSLWYRAFPDYDELSEQEQGAAWEQTLGPELNRRGGRVRELFLHYRAIHEAKKERKAP